MPRGAELTIVDAIRYIELKKRCLVREHLTPEEKAASIKRDTRTVVDTVKIPQLTEFFEAIRRCGSKVITTWLPEKMTRKEKKELEELIDKYNRIGTSVSVASIGAEIDATVKHRHR